MRLLIICFVAGAALLQWQPALPAIAAWWVAVPAALLALSAWRPRPPLLHLSRRIVAALLCVVSGFMWAAWRADARMQDELPLASEGVDVRIVGIVAQLPQPYERSLRFEFDVESVSTPQVSVPAHIALSWWGTAPGDTQAGTIPDLHPGERWQLTVRLRRSHGLQNPNGFDYEAWLLERAVRATGYVRAPATARRLAAFVWRPQYLIERVREAVRSRLATALPGARYAAVLAALAIGDQRGIPPEQWQVFTRTGVNHLISISGLHVTMISGLVLWLAYFLWSRSTYLLTLMPARKAAAIAGLFAAAAYAWLAGFAIPAQRTVYMLAVVAAALWQGRWTAPGAVLCAALLLVVVIDPWAALSAGFWLSFGAVAVILFVSCHRLAAGHWLAAWARVQWAVTLGLTPVLIALFQQVSLISPLANAIAIPVISLAVVPLTLIGILLPGTWVLQGAHMIMEACGALLQWLSDLPSAIWQQHAPSAGAIAVAMAGVFWLLLPRGFPARWIGVFALLPMFMISPALLPEGALRLAVLDVGQGLAVVVQTRHHALLYDSGTLYGPQSDSGNRVIVPFLRASGIATVDTMIISHGDKDHAGGAAAVLQALPVAGVMSSASPAEVSMPARPDLRPCVAGDRWRWDDVEFEILHPALDHYALNGRRSNDRSCVLRVATGASSILLTADIERKAERELLAAVPEKLAAQILLVPHHGSRTSSSEEFIARVNPQVALVAAGYRNRFGHPKDDVLDRYRLHGSRIYRTDLDGALIIAVDAAGVSRIVRQRVAGRRYWHAAPENPDIAEDGDEEY